MSKTAECLRILPQFEEHYNKELKIEKSLELEKSGREKIAGFTQSMMKCPEQFSKGQFPIYIESGQGAIVRDVDGNEYIDFICGLAANTLGHNHPVVTEAITKNLSKGLIHSLPTEVELKTAEKLIEVIPGAEMVRFFKTGADATSSAVRLSRHITGREEIMTIGYNGWHDHFMFDTPGVPKVLEEKTHRMPLFIPPQEAGVLAKIRERADNLACVLLSVPYNRELNKEFLQDLRDLCTEKGVILVFDEIVTGFRVALGGIQEYFGVQADLVTLSKGLAAGMPLSAIVGRKELMTRMSELQVSTTFGGEMLSLEVCAAVIDHYRESDAIAEMSRLGRKLKEEINSIAQELNIPLKIVGYDPIPFFVFQNTVPGTAEVNSRFLAEMAKRRVLLRRDVSFLSNVHTEEHIDHLIDAIIDSTQVMKADGLFD